MKKLTRESVRELLRSQEEAYTPRAQLAREYGVDVSHIYRILRGEHDLVPEGYDPSNLKPVSYEALHPTALLTEEQVREIRALRQQQYIPTVRIADQYGVREHVIRPLLRNQTHYDPNYDPLSLKDREYRGNPGLRTKGYIYGLYCTCHPEAGIRYVGQTSADPIHRVRAHRSASKKSKPSDYYCLKSAWIREHGADNIDYFVLEKDPPLGLDEAEARWIAELETLMPTGLNMTVGGYAGAGGVGEDNPSAKLDEETVNEIIDRIGTDRGCTSHSLAAEYGVTKTLILKIDHGDLWTELPRPHGVRVLGKYRKNKPLSEEEKELIRGLHAKGLNAFKISKEVGRGHHSVQKVLRQL